jgi:hypothetical protein
MKKLENTFACVVAPPGIKPVGSFDVRHGADEDIVLRIRDKAGAVSITISTTPDEWKLICDTIAEVDKHKSHELFPCYACDKLTGSEPPVS